MSTLLLIEAGFQVCPCGGQLGMWEKCSPASDNNLSNSLQRPKWHSEESEEPDKHHFFDKKFFRKTGKNAFVHQYLTTFKMMKYFMLALHNWTKEWCDYLDYNRTIDISHKSSPEQLERYATLLHP